MGSAATAKRLRAPHSAAKDAGPLPQSKTRASEGTSESAKNASYSTAARPQGGTRPPSSNSRDTYFLSTDRTTDAVTVTRQTATRAQSETV